MIKNSIVVIETIIMLGVGIHIYPTLYQHKEAKTVQLSKIRSGNEAKVIRFPEVKLGADERITQAELIFQTTYIKSIRNREVNGDGDAKTFYC